MQNIIAVLFSNEAEGYQATTELRRCAVTEQYSVMQMSLVKRIGDSIKYCDGFDTGLVAGSGAAVGGLMGSILGILGGPLGVLLMGSYGALMGETVGAAASVDNSMLVEQMTSKLVDGEMALIILAEEKEEAYLDSVFSKFDVDIIRCDAAQIAAEVDEAIRLQEENEHLELVDLRKAREKEYKEAVEKEKAKLEAEFEKFRQKLAKEAQAEYMNS